MGSRLKKAGKKAGMVSMEVRYYDFRNMSHQVQLQKPTNGAVVKGTFYKPDGKKKKDGI